MSTTALLCNLIPAFIVLYYFVRGWTRGALYMVISVIRLIGSFLIAQIASRYIADYLMQNPVVRSQIATFALNNQYSLNALPGASLLLSGRVINDTIESISWWIIYAICFIIVMAIIVIIFSLLLRLAIDFNKIPVLGFFNKLGGTIFGLIYGLALTLILIYIVSFILNILGYHDLALALTSSWLPILFRTYY